MEKTLSGTSLFHFTNCLDNVISILKNGFYPRLCFEDGVVDKQFDQLPDTIIPMVCFCDMRLSDATRGRHTIDYGEYAIGVTKDWAKEYGVCPVLYTFPKSHTDERLNVSFTEQAMGLIYGNIYNIYKDEKNKVFKPNLDNVLNGLGILHSYTKRYEGYLYKNWERQPELIRFYDEREWRYVPIIVDVNGENVFVYDILSSLLRNANSIFNSKVPIKVIVREKEQKLEKKDFIELQNSQFKCHALKMTSDDIKYIIVKKKNEIQKIKTEMNKISYLKSLVDTITIISLEDFQNDL